MRRAHQRVAERFRVLGRELEAAWDGIGDWQG